MSILIKRQDPIEVRILPEAIEIISFNGADSSLKQADFDKGKVSDQVISIFEFCQEPKSRQEVLSFLGLKNHSVNFKRHVHPLIERGYLDYTIKENLKDRNQKYIITDLGKSILHKTERPSI